MSIKGELPKSVTELIQSVTHAGMFSNSIFTCLLG